jgi:L-alanine-DL-glutamate epimerase-like enolase superfamily enzyme
MTNSSNLIDSLEIYTLSNPNDVKPHWVSHFIVPTANELLIKIKTKDGNSGFGMATSYTDITPIIKPFKNGLQDLIIGEDPFCPEKIYDKIFKLTDTKISSEKGWSREALIRISAALDIACWDLIGKAANIPLYKLFGGYRNKIPVYVTCAYYRDDKDEKELRDELKKLIEIGHQSFKVKVGGLSIKEDAKRLEIIRDEIGSQKDLMIDVNRAWDLATAVEGVNEFKKFKPTWIEEPVRWEDDRRNLKLLSKQTEIPLSGGESEITIYGCRSMIEEDAIQILQFDCTMFGGFTNGKKLSALCEINHIDIAPHHDCYIHAPLVASSPSGRIVESFDNERDPLQSELFENVHKMSNGWIYLNENPGLGFEISETALKKFGKLVYKK